MSSANLWQFLVAQRRHAAASMWLRVLDKLQDHISHAEEILHLRNAIVRDQSMLMAAGIKALRDKIDVELNIMTTEPLALLNGRVRQCSADLLMSCSH